MEIKDKIEALAGRIADLKGSVTTEESTKHSFVMPFLQALGYDVFDPNVIVPEYIADIGKKKGEKVDYAILNDGEPLIFIEVKTHSEKLDNHHNQLVRYFQATKSCKFSILTNGIEYRFFTDIDDANVMDTVPFLIINFESLKSRDVKELEKFAKDSLDIEKIVTIASRRKYLYEIKKIFKEQVENPEDEFVKFFASKIVDKRMTQGIVDEFRGHVKSSFNEIISDLASEKINSIKSGLSIEAAEEVEEESTDDGIVTTEEETEGYFIVKSILAEITEAKNITPKDTKSYFAVLFQNNVRKWICRLHFNTGQKYIGLHINEKEETKHPIECVEDIYNFREQIKSIVSRYL